MITDAIFEGVNRQMMKKPSFLFVDVITKPNDSLFEICKWFYEVRDRYMYLID